ncbi:MAG: limonene-1,2-epoxide hydrolase family protein [Ketobacteraceae bacterium]|nr:limonene-1,2-epoxide hydrolase family protein [Ketobacteraceae bacterium]
MPATLKSVPANRQNNAREVVERFFTACCALDFDGALELIDERCVYRNVPFHKARGKERIRRDLTLMAKGMTAFDVDMIHLAVSGNTVLTERVDTLTGRFFRAELPLMGVLVVENGKITEWRDYFDWSAMMGKITGSILMRPFRRS